MVFDWVGFAITAATLVVGVRTGYVLARKAARLMRAGAWRKSVERCVGPLVTVWPLIFAGALLLGSIIFRWLADGVEGVQEVLLGLLFLRDKGAVPGGLLRSQMYFYGPIAVSISNHLSWRVLRRRIGPRPPDAKDAAL